MGSEAELKQHVFATARAVSLPALIAARGPLVALGTRPPRLTEGPAAHSPAEHVLATRTVLAALSAEPADRFGAVEVDERRGRKSRQTYHYIDVLTGQVELFDPESGEHIFTPLGNQLEEH